ncbi:MAG: carbon starvation protein A [Oscillospiraceae bacterium]|nr:carbon starvation protein A [Oscillospiraceae bacterium]
MITFLLCLVLLLMGYWFYGRRVDRIFGPDDRETPALAINDGVDFVPMKGWKIFLIQLLNIAGLGPIFGALNGALFGPVVYLWIVLGTIFAGGVHDYMSGMMSMRHRGASVSELTGIYLGNGMKQVMRVFSVVLLVMVGVVFSKGPAGLLALLTPDNLDANFWLTIVIVYYFVATFVPVDKVIGKIYPLFGICLLVMAFGVAAVLLFSGDYVMPELWANFENQHASGTSIWPFMFVTVACGAISGFHATQSPMMARCCTSEKQGHKVFYGAMVAEGVIAMVWAAAGVSFYENSQALLEAGAGVNAVVFEICQTTMGKVGGALAMLGVIACPITSGDTAYRSARLTLADWFGIDQTNWRKRLALTAPLLGVGALICQIDYSVIWRYFSWSNQTLAMIALWAGAMFLYKNGKAPWMCAVPAVFMSAVSVTYFVCAPECLGLLWKPMGVGAEVYYPLAIAVGIIAAAAFGVVFLKKSIWKK